ncbi:sensor histidine kinase [Oceanicola granulosus]|uniref:sensor histidine kinase n=1 Tax=Oceanicola granulosus TaxID=252302 RepID=UPI0012EA65C6|nr:ATP-binding protein [Oceanicola granulosus]
MKPLRLSLQAKFALLAFSVALLSSSVVITLGQLIEAERREERAEEALETAAQQHVEPVRRQFNLMAADAELLAAMPIISSITAGGGVSPSLRSRSESLFVGMLRSRPHYSQVRFIGQKSDWRELVRVDQGPSGIERVRGGSLQSKAAEPYLASLQSLQSGEAYFSRITYNREHGQPVGPPTIRVVQPVQDTSGQLFGVIVINADFERMLQTAGENFSDDFEVTIATDVAEYMSFGTGLPPRLVFRDERKSLSDERAAILEESSTVAVLDEEVIYRSEVVVPAAGTPFSLYVLTVAREEDLFRPTVDLLGVGIASLIFSATSASLASLIGAGITAPLRRLTATIRSSGTETLNLASLQPEADDEAGELARAFAELADRLQRESERYRTLFAGIADGVMSVRRDGTIEDVNDAMEDLFGYEKAELVGRKIDLLLPPDILREWTDLASKNPVPQLTNEQAGIRGLRSDGNIVPLEVSISRIEVAGGEQFIAIVRDISERLQADEQTAKLLAALQTSNAELDKFAYVASHDLRAPLRVIQNAAVWLEEDLAPHLTEDTRESLDLLQVRVERMDRLLDDLLQHSRIGRDEDVAEFTTGGDVIDAVAALLCLPDGFHLNVGEDFLHLRLRRMPIQMILLNLIGNAIKHHDQQHGSVDVSARDAGAMHVIRIEDDGPGIPPKYHEKVFEMFQTLKPRDHVDGSGMGLALVKKQTEVAGGSIRLYSDGQRGSAFELHWPKVAIDNRQGEIAA